MGAFRKFSDGERERDARRQLVTRVQAGETIYEGRVVDAKDSVSKSGNEMLVITLEVSSPSGTVQLVHYAVTAWWLKNALEALGPEYLVGDKSKELDGPGLRVLVNRRCRVEVGVEAGKAEPRPVVKKLLPIGTAATPASK